MTRLWSAILTGCLASVLSFPGNEPSAADHKQIVRSSYSLRASVMSCGGTPGSSTTFRGKCTMAQPTPIGVSSSADKVVYGGFWAKPWVLASVFETVTRENLTTRLWQNVPNPFAASTRIRYSVAEEGLVLIRVFNVKGQKIGTLVSEIQAPGNYLVCWDGKDENGTRVCPGVYFCQLKVDSHRSVMKILLLN